MREHTDEYYMTVFRENCDQENGMNVLVKRYTSPARAVARQYLGDTLHCDDAVQETFLRLVRNRHRYTPGKPFAPWFYTILRNVCLDIIRKRNIQQNAITELMSDQPGIHANNQDSVDLSILDRLDQKEKQVLYLRIVKSLTFDEIASALGITAESAKKRSQRGIIRLRQMVHNERHPSKEITKECAV